MSTLRRVDARTYKADSAEMHRIVEMIWRGRSFFKAKGYEISELILHIPLPLQAVLLQVLSEKDVLTQLFEGAISTKIWGMEALPAYENRIVISHPAYAIYENEPMVVIEFENETNYPLYYEIN